MPFPKTTDGIRGVKGSKRKTELEAKINELEMEYQTKKVAKERKEKETKQLEEECRNLENKTAETAEKVSALENIEGESLERLEGLRHRLKGLEGDVICKQVEVNNARCRLATLEKEAKELEERRK